MNPFLRSGNTYEKIRFAQALSMIPTIGHINFSLIRFDRRRLTQTPYNLRRSQTAATALI